jgi:hypothetical protein
LFAQFHGLWPLILEKPEAEVQIERCGQGNQMFEARKKVRFL